MPVIHAFLRAARRGQAAVVWVGTIAVLLIAHGALAQGGFALPAPPSGIPAESLPTLIARVIRAALLLVGVVALGFIVYGGFRYILSRGDEKDVASAKQTITYAVIGIVVIGISYMIVSFIFTSVFEQQR